MGTDFLLSAPRVLAQKVTEPIVLFWVSNCTIRLRMRVLRRGGVMVEGRVASLDTHRASVATAGWDECAVGELFSCSKLDKPIAPTALN